MIDPVLQLIVTLIVSGAGALLGSYLSEKGKNRATKEDIKDITHQVESVKTELGFLAHTQNFAYEEEFKALKIIWHRLIQFRKSTLALRPVQDQGYLDAAAQAEEKARRLQQFDNDRFELAKAIEYFKPFYPQAIFTELDKLLEICIKEAMGYKHGNSDKIKYWEAAENNRKAIIENIERVIVLVRQRTVRGYEPSLSIDSNPAVSARESTDQQELTQSSQQELTHENESSKPKAIEIVSSRE